MSGMRTAATISSPKRASASVNPDVAAPAPVPVEIPLKQILVANNTIPAGKFVSLDDLKWQGWPADAQMDSFIDKEKEEVGSIVTSGSYRSQQNE